MEAARIIREARQAAALTQQQLAARSSTSQPAISAYESGRKQPSAPTLARLVSACGARLTFEAAGGPPLPAEAELAERGRRLLRVLELAAALPSSDHGELTYPRLRQQG